MQDFAGEVQGQTGVFFVGFLISPFFIQKDHFYRAL